MEYVYLEFLNELIKKGLIPKAQGCSPEEISTIEKIMNATLPKAYVEFLSLAGKDSPWHDAEAGNFFHRFEYMIKDIPKKVQDYVDWGMNDLVLPQKYIPLWHHDGFSYIKLDEGDNPPIYVFSPGPFATHFIGNDTFLGYVIDLVQHTLIGYSTFGEDSGWNINYKITIAANKGKLHPWRILAEKTFEP